MIRAPLAALALVALGRAAAAEPATLVEHDVVDVSPPPGVRIDDVTIDNRYGDVTVIGHDAPQVAIEATKRAPIAGALDRLKVQLVPDARGGVAVTALIKGGDAETPLPAGAVRIDLVVRVPRAAHVSARLWKGRAFARGLDGGVSLAVDQGEIAVEEVSGEVEGETSRGAQRYAHVFGALDVRGVDGDVALERVRGRRLAATVWKGQIVGTRIAVRELAIELGQGDVRLELEALRGGRYAVATGRGDVRVTLARRGGVEVRARGATGVEVPRRLRTRRGGPAGELIGALGASASPAVLDLSSKTGSVTVAEF